MTEPKLSAARLFDALGADYERAFAHAPAHLASLRWLSERLAPGSEVLDLGSGTGRPTARTLADAGHRVLGVDVAPGMVERARAQVPNATFRCQDARTLERPAASLDAVCVYFSLLQLPRIDQRQLIEKIAHWLRPGGHLVLATVTADAEGLPIRWMGHELEVTSFTAEDLTALLGGAGFAVLETHAVDFLPEAEQAVPEPQFFVYATRR
ncbi:class I SAM-dependent methyltransferase [Streptomyces sp. NPDC057638]|uniref:class I SAM-dependent methyltransferase n=1 Tax=Streptomyces sp. NPDC057638 TaxID=3346190 RepID=UPI0036CE4BAE